MRQFKGLVFRSAWVPGAQHPLIARCLVGCPKKDLTDSRRKPSPFQHARETRGLSGKAYLSGRISDGTPLRLVGDIRP
jgi:hypothetical protein